MRRNPPGVKLFYAAQLIWLQAGGVPYYVLDSLGPPFTQRLKACAESRLLPERSSLGFSFRLKLQDE